MEFERSASQYIMFTFTFTFYTLFSIINGTDFNIKIIYTYNFNKEAINVFVSIYFRGFL